VSDTEEEVHPQEMYRIDEVAEILRVSGETVRTWAKDGKLEGFKIGRTWRISRESLETFVKGSYT